MTLLCADEFPTNGVCTYLAMLPTSFLCSIWKAAANSSLGRKERTYATFLELMLAGTVADVKVGMAALGFALIFFVTRQMHFAFGAIAVLGGYLTYWLASALG